MRMEQPHCRIEQEFFAIFFRLFRTEFFFKTAIYKLYLSGSSVKWYGEIRFFTIYFRPTVPIGNGNGNVAKEKV